MGLALFDVARQSAVAVSRARLAAGGATTPDEASATIAAALPIIGSTEQQLLDALWAARKAAAPKPGADRVMLGDDAVRMAMQARSARPEWGEAEVVVAYAASLGRGPSDRQVARQALTASYATAPFLHDAGQWRIAYGVGIWPTLGRPTQDAILREAVWMLGVDQSRWSRVFATFRGTPAYVPFMLRWRAVLSGAPEDTPGMAEAQSDQRQE